MKKTSDKASQSLLVRRARQGEREAFAALVSTHTPRLLSLASRVVGDWEDARDVVQTSLWKAHRRLADCRDEAAFSSWLTRITINEGIGLIRRRAARPVIAAGIESDQFAGDALPGGSSSPDPEEICRLNEARSLIEKSLNRLRPDYKMILEMRGIEEMSCREIATRLGLSLATVKTRIYRARQQLRATPAGRLFGSSPEPVYPLTPGGPNGGIPEQQVQ